MELEPVVSGPETEGLMPAVVRIGQPGSPPRQVESFPVPVKNRFSIGKFLKQGVSFPFFGKVDGSPADFRYRIPIDAGAEGMGEQLGPEANAQDRYVTPHRLLDQLELTPDVFQLVVDRHGASQENQAGEAGRKALWGQLTKTIHVVVPEPHAVEHGGQRPQVFLGNVTEGQERFGHGVARGQRVWPFR